MCIYFLHFSLQKNDTIFLFGTRIPWRWWAPGWLIDVIMADNMSIIKEIALADGHLKVERGLLDHLGMNKTCVRLVPRFFLGSPMGTSGWMWVDDQPIWESMLTDYETMVLYYDPYSKRNQWNVRRPDGPIVA